MKTISRLGSVVLAISMLAAGLNSSFAQGYVVDAQISSQAVGDGTYNYTITLNNEASSMNPIGTFWFAWLPDDYGHNLLTSYPNSVQTPAGWYGYVSGPNYYYYPDGYGIQYYASGAGLMPGQSLTFGFNSSDAPSVVEGNSQYDGGVLTTASYVYMGYAEGDPGAEVFVTAAPEPSSLGLLAVGMAGFAFVLRNRWNPRRLSPVALLSSRNDR